VTDPIQSKARIREVLLPQPSGPASEMLWLTGASPEALERMRSSLSATPIPAAVLVPLVERERGLTVLLTQRSTRLKAHAGQISFPGGRIEPEDADAWQAALREAHEEIGLSDGFVEFAGYLPDHWVGTGFRVTPAVGIVDPRHELRIATAEVHDVFEVPLSFVLDEANHRARTRVLAGSALTVYDIPYGERNIWGATAGMLLTLRRLLQARADGPRLNP
jgi:8-oxo-dGTP pyrophosphatase MutT (NUDIX family)